MNSQGGQNSNQQSGQQIRQKQMAQSNQQDSDLNRQINELKKAAVINKKTRGNASQPRGSGTGSQWMSQSNANMNFIQTQMHPQLISSDKRQNIAAHQMGNHPQTTKHGGVGINLINNTFINGAVGGPQTPNDGSAMLYQQPNGATSNSKANLHSQFQQNKNAPNQFNQQQMFSNKRAKGHAKSNSNVDGNMVRSQSRGGSRSGYGNSNGLALPQNNQLVFSAGATGLSSPQSSGQQAYNGGVAQSQNFAANIMAPLLQQQPGQGNQGINAQQNQNRAQSRSQYRGGGPNGQQQQQQQQQNANAQYFSVPNVNHQSANKEKTSQLLKNYEQIIRKEKQSSMGSQQANMRGSQDFTASGAANNFQNSGQGGTNTHILKRINANQSTTSQNKSLHNDQKQSRHGQRSQSNLRKSHGMGFQASQQQVLNLNAQGNSAGTKFHMNSSQGNGLAAVNASDKLQNITNLSNVPQTVKNISSQGMSTNSALQRALKSTDSRGEGSIKDLQASKQSSAGLRGQKDVIIRKNSSKQFVGTGTAGARPRSSQRGNQDSFSMQKLNAVDSMQRVNDEGISTGQAGMARKKQGSVVPHNAGVQLQGHNYDVALNNSSYMTGSTNGQHGHAGITSPVNMMTTQKKTLNMSNHQGQLGMAHNVIQYDSMIDEKRDQSTLNDLQFFTLAKTGLLNNLNLSQLIKQQGILEDDGIEDMHFYFVSFNNHKNRVLYNQEVKLKMQERRSSGNQRNKSSQGKQSDKQKGGKQVIGAKKKLKDGKSVGSGNAVDSPKSARTIESLEDHEADLWNK